MFFCALSAIIPHRCRQRKTPYAHIKLQGTFSLHTAGILVSAALCAAPRICSAIVRLPRNVFFL